MYMYYCVVDKFVFPFGIDLYYIYCDRLKLHPHSLFACLWFTPGILLTPCPQHFPSMALASANQSASLNFSSFHPSISSSGDGRSQKSPGKKVNTFCRFFISLFFFLHSRSSNTWRVLKLLQLNLTSRTSNPISKKNCMQKGDTLFSWCSISNLSI